MENETKIVDEKKESIFQERLNELIQESGKSQKDLADYVGITRQSISLYAAGKRTPDIDVLKEVCNFFKVSADYLLGRTDLRSSDIDYKEINKRLGLTDKAINFLEEDFINRGPEGIIFAINSLIGQTEPEPRYIVCFDTGEKIENPFPQSDVFELINTYLKTKFEGTVRITKDGIFNRVSMSDSEKNDLSKFIASFPEDSFIDFFYLDRVKTELTKAKEIIHRVNKE